MSNHLKKIDKTKGLKHYLEAENTATQDSLSRWNTQVELFGSLGDLYDRLLTISQIKSPEGLIPAKLFLVVHSQMYGVVSQLLRRRLTDAEALTRRAIEGTAIAHRLWKNPALFEAFSNAYPNFANDGHENQWKTSKDYNTEFNSRKLFNSKDPTWSYLKDLYKLFSALSSHAGPFAIAFHENRGREIVHQYIEADNKSIRLAWNYLLDAYWEMLRIFLFILRHEADERKFNDFEKEINIWRKNSSELLRNAKPCPTNT